MAPLMNAAEQNDFPLDLLGILGLGEFIERLATTRTSLLIFGEIMYHLFRRQVVASFSAMTLRTGAVGLVCVVAHR